MLSTKIYKSHKEMRKYDLYTGGWGEAPSIEFVHEEAKTLD